MWIKTDKGSTECHVERLAAIEPAVLKVREGYRRACAEAPDKKDAHQEKVLHWAVQRFGKVRFNKDYDTIVPPVVGRFGVEHEGGTGIRKWDEFLAARTTDYRLWYLAPEVVAGCIMGDDE